MAQTVPAALDALPRSIPAPRRHTAMSLRAMVFIGFGVPLALVAVLACVGIEASQGSVQVLIAMLAAVAILVGIAMAMWIARRVTAPLHEAVAVARRISSGDLTGTVRELRGGGEIGELMRALREMHARLFDVVSAVRSGTTTVAGTSSQMTRDNEALAQRTEGQTAALQETAAAMEELTAAVRQNADNARQANALVMTASGRAEHGGALMSDVVRTMGTIRESSRRIVDIIGAVDGIAFQTNILALNAAVEAARAGAQGRGFAVVAGEVRSLAQRCAEAAREIKALIAESVDSVDAGGKQVDDAGRAVQEIVTSVQQVATLVSDIDLASREQSSGIEAINQALAKVDRMTQRNAGVVTGAARSAATLNQQAVALLKSVETFDLGAREYGTPEEAQAMVQAGIEFFRAHGEQALVEDINRLGEGRFIDRDLYLMVYRLDDGARLLAHGNNPRLVGFDGSKYKDVDGKPFVAEMMEVARTRGSGWIEFKWAHPVTNEIRVKTSYFERVGDLVFVCGAYKT